MENNNKQIMKNSKILVTNKCNTNLCGVSKVNSATESCVSLVLAGENLTIEGKSLYVNKLDIETGIIDLEGEIHSIKFGKSKSGNFIKRIFS